MKEISRENKIFIAIVIAAFTFGGFVYFFNIDKVEARSERLKADYWRLNLGDTYRNFPTQKQCIDYCLNVR